MSEAPPSPDDPLPSSLPPGDAVGATEAAVSDLPEEEPLSPEILEDEAIRGDVVIRWAVVGLAFLWGCTQINDARVMVHVRSGEWLAQHGVLPPATDPFSITAADRRWVNLSWLFDLFTAAVHQAGPIALSLMQAVLAAAAFWLLGHAVRPGIRTWWGSICGVLVLLTAYPQFELRPELITLLGLSEILAILISSETDDHRQRLWWLPAVMWLWAQCDPRCWIGVAVLAVSLLGPRPAWRPILIAIGVTLIHPFLWETWLAPWRQYAIEYPALRDSYPRPSANDLVWYPLWSEWLVEHFSHRIAAGLFLAASAFVALWLNRSRTTLRDWLWYVGANVLGAVTLHEAPAAAVINAVLATVHGQEWYKQRFGQVYSVVTAEIAFSRGGRAVTVLAMVALAWVVISGRVDGPDGHRTGVGLSRPLAVELDSFRRLNGTTFDDAGFHFTLRQGDALIAAGRKSFVDHRVALFAGDGEQNWLRRHQLVRRLLRSSNPPPLTAEERLLAEQSLIEARISHVMPRLSASLSEPDYRTLLDLLSTPAWRLTDILPSVAVFHRAEFEAPEWKTFLVEHEVNVLDRAFRKVSAIALDPQDPIRPPTWSERWFSRERQALGGGTLEASHWLRLTEAANQSPLPFRLSCATLAVRAARRGTRETPKVAEAHRLLGEAYRLLGLLEAASLGEQAAGWNQSIRYYQAMAASQQARTLDPDNPRIAGQLFRLWQSAGKVDAALDALTDMLELLPINEGTTENEQAERQMLEVRQRELADIVASVQNQSDAALREGQERLNVAIGCHEAGCVQMAVTLLEDDAVLLEQQPQARLLLTMWLGELGRPEELIDSAARLQGLIPRGAGGPWQEALAVAALARGDEASAIAAWKTSAAATQTGRMQTLLHTAPMATSSPIWLSDLQFPTAHLAAAQDSVDRTAHQATLLALNIALCEILRGDSEAASDALASVLETSADTPLRPLVRAYWFCLKDEMLDQPAKEPQP